MNDKTRVLEQNDEGILAFDVSDDTLEAAASMTRDAAVSLLGAPTVSVLVVCCSNDIAAREPD